MNTKGFNTLDKIIAYTRYLKVKPYILENNNILDIGCGYKSYLLNKSKYKINKGVGIDYEVDEKYSNDNIKLINYTFNNKLPFNNSSFDTIFMLAVLEHIDLNKVSILFNEVNRVLKPNGYFILTTPTNKGKYVLEFLSYRLKVISKEEIDDHKKYYKKEDLIRLTNDNTFQIEKYKKFFLGCNSIIILKKDQYKE